MFIGVNIQQCIYPVFVGFRSYWVFVFVFRGKGAGCKADGKQYGHHLRAQCAEAHSSARTHCLCSAFLARLSRHRALGTRSLRD